MRSIQSGKVSWGVPGNRGAFLFPEGRTYSPLPRKGQWWYCLRQPCALRGGCGSCGSLWTMPHFRGKRCHCPRSWRLLYKGASANCLRKPATGGFVAAMGIAAAMPIFFFTKRNKNENEGTVKTNGDLSFGSKGHQPGRRTICLRCFRLPELFQNSE